MSPTQATSSIWCTAVPRSGSGGRIFTTTRTRWSMRMISASRFLPQWEQVTNQTSRSKAACEKLSFSCPGQLNRWPCHSLTDSLRTLLIVTQKTIQLTSDFPDIWSEWWGDMSWPTKRQRQRHIQQRHHLRIWDFENRQITARNHHDLANIGWNNLKIMTVAILETCDIYDIWSKWWGDLTWPKKWPTCYLPTYLSTLRH